MSGFEADLPAIDATAAALRATVEALDVDLSADGDSGDLGPGSLGAAVSAVLAGARADLERTRVAVTDLSDTVAGARAAYAELDTNVASRFDRDPW
ncbi:MAG: hypothetical protein LC635_03745 [Pseudonocardiaceae bacterium]|nr:hypothetical protein [Pseudonocardiaceae bacterium]